MSKIPGFESRITKGGIYVRRYHHSADARKRPGTVAGDLWIKEESQAYPLGTQDPRWAKEMDIKYGALGGQFIFPQWGLWKQHSKIFLHPFDPVGYKLYGAFDYGFNNPSCYLVVGSNSDDEYVVLWEFYADHVPSHLIAEIIKGHTVETDDGRQFTGNPFAGREEWMVADPSIWAEDLPQHRGPNKSTAAIFRENGVVFLEGDRGGDTTVANWLLGYFWADPQQPKIRITTGCTKLIWELGNLRNKELSETVAFKKNNPEELLDKDNHAWDAFKYFIKKFPPPPSVLQQNAPPASFQWWRKLAEPEKHKGFSIGRNQRKRTQRTYRIGS